MHSLSDGADTGDGSWMKVEVMDGTPVSGGREELDDGDAEMESASDSDASEEYLPTKQQGKTGAPHARRISRRKRQQSCGSSMGSFASHDAPPGGVAVTNMPGASPASPYVPSTAHHTSAPSPAAAPSLPAHGTTRGPSEASPHYRIVFKESQLKARDGTLWGTKPLLHGDGLQHHRKYFEGPSIVTEGAATPEECLHLFLDDSFYAIIVKHTNEMIDILSQRASSLSSTERTTEGEVRALVGVLLLAGSRRDSCIATSELWDARFGAPLYRAAMTERRFHYLLRCLRFDDHTTRRQRGKTDRFAPVRILWENFFDKCRLNYIPGENITIDEQVLGFRGRCVFRTHIANKPNNYGLKMIMANDSKTSYLLNAMPALGETSEVGGVESLGLYYTMAVMRPFLGRYHNVTATNSLMSLSLAKALLQEKTTTVGALHRKSYVPVAMTDPKKERHPNSTAFLYADQLMLVSLKQNADEIVVLLTSKHQTAKICENSKTEAAHLYDTTKGSTDAFQQMCRGYSCSRNAKRWPLRIFYAVVNAAAVNSYIVYGRKCSDRHAETVGRRRFMQEAAYGLVKPWAQQRLSQQPPRHTVLNIHSVLGWDAAALPSTPGPLAKREKTCDLCARSGDTKTTAKCLYCTRAACGEHFVCCECL